MPLSIGSLVPDLSRQLSSSFSTEPSFDLAPVPGLFDQAELKLEMEGLNLALVAMTQRLDRATDNQPPSLLRLDCLKDFWMESFGILQVTPFFIYFCACPHSSSILPPLPLVILIIPPFIYLCNRVTCCDMFFFFF